MSPARRRLAVLSAVVAVALFVVFGLREAERDDGSGGPDPTPAEPSPVAESLPPVEPAPRFVAEALPAAPPPARPGDPQAAASPDAPRRDPGFCPEPGEEIVVTERPGLAQLLNERTDELVARARLSSTGRGSDALRRGLSRLNDGDGVAAIESLSAAPDRYVDGFDFASAAAVASGARALAEGSGPERVVNAALRAADDEAIVHVLAAHVARIRSDEAGARGALARAFAIDDEEPAIALALGRALAHTPDEDGALRALRVYLEAYPEDVEITRLAARLALRRDVADGFSRIDRAGLSLRYHPSIGRDAAERTLTLAFEVLAEAGRLLGVPPRQELAIVAYGSKDELRAVTCVPGWAGGVYDGTLRLSRSTVVDASERSRVVRHEGLHAALGAAAGPTPYWFNEGLAQRFAHESGPGHEASWARIRRSGMVIPFPSLDGSFLDIDDPQDARLAYHQSLAMVDLLAARRSERVFAEAVTYLRAGGDRRELLSALSGARPITSDDLVEFLRRGE